MILVIDNYDSFVHNLARYFEREGASVRIVRNDAITVDEIRDMNPVGIVLSPGPCSPDEAGICLDIVRDLGGTIPILGVCLGHQAIGQAYGGETVRSVNPRHGKASMIAHNGCGLFEGVSSPLRVARYHSLVVDMASSKDLDVLAKTDSGEVMAFMHTRFPVYGVQFHPESILTDQGDIIVQNFLAIAQGFHKGNERVAA